MLTEYIWGCHATVIVFRDKGVAGGGGAGGQADSHVPVLKIVDSKGQFGLKSFSGEIECSFSVQHPPSPKP